jgi:hypothetical protein
MFPVAWVGVGPPGCGFVAQVKSVTGQLAPDALMTICDEVAEDDDVVVQPVKVLSPTTPTTKKSRICKRRRFLSPRKHRKPANIVAANTALLDES